MYGCLPDHFRSLQYVQKRLLDFLKGQRLRARTRDDHQIYSSRDHCLQTSHRLAYEPLDSVANDGVAYFFADGNACPKSSFLLLHGRIYDKLLVRRRLSSLKHSLKVLIFFEPM
jgi:hypothetical protein